LQGLRYSSTQSHSCPLKRRNIPEGSNTRQDRCENHKPHTSQHSAADVLVLAQQEKDTFTYSSFAKGEVLPSAPLKVTVLWELPAAVPLTVFSVLLRKGLRSEFHLILLGKFNFGGMRGETRSTHDGRDKSTQHFGRKTVGVHSVDVV
jgi:hypothetical protein